ncbi:hypothetical protein QOT17_010471 [Balamuthia mandrillaris]
MSSNFFSKFGGEDANRAAGKKEEDLLNKYKIGPGEASATTASVIIRTEREVHNSSRSMPKQEEDLLNKYKIQKKGGEKAPDSPSEPLRQVKNMHITEKKDRQEDSALDQYRVDTNVGASSTNNNFPSGSFVAREIKGMNHIPKDSKPQESSLDKYKINNKSSSPAAAPAPAPTPAPAAKAAPTSAAQLRLQRQGIHIPQSQPQSQPQPQPQPQASIKRDEDPLAKYKVQSALSTSQQHLPQQQPKQTKSSTAPSIKKGNDEGDFSLDKYRISASGGGGASAAVGGGNREKETAIPEGLEAYKIGSSPPTEEDLGFNSEGTFLKIVKASRKSSQSQRPASDFLDKYKVSK